MEAALKMSMQQFDDYDEQLRQAIKASQDESPFAGYVEDEEEALQAALALSLDQGGGL